MTFLIWRFSLQQLYGIGAAIYGLYWIGAFAFVPSLIGGILLILKSRSGVWISIVGWAVLMIASIIFTPFFLPPWGIVFPIAISSIMIALIAIGRNHVAWKR